MWRSQAACQGTDLVLWYGPPLPEEDPAGYVEDPEQRKWRERRALAICADCPVRAPCLAEELRLPESKQFGVRGGTTETQRRVRIRRERRAPKAA